MQLFESGEMYLETILVLMKEKGTDDALHIHAVDISEAMGFSKPSVSRALSNLKEGGFITVEDNGDVMLTKTGRKVAEKIYAMHTTLTEFFVKLGVDEKIASEDACKIEHVISDDTFRCICEHLQKMD